MRPDLTGHTISDRGRHVGHPTLPAQIRTCATNAYGFHEEVRFVKGEEVGKLQLLRKMSDQVSIRTLRGIVSSTRCSMKFGPGRRCLLHTRPRWAGDCTHLSCCKPRHRLLRETASRRLGAEIDYQSPVSAAQARCTRGVRSINSKQDILENSANWMVACDKQRAATCLAPERPLWHDRNCAAAATTKLQPRFRRVR